MTTRQASDRPPAAATWLIARTLPRVTRTATLGDLHERFRARVAESGRAAARRWYWRQTLAFLTELPVEHVSRLGGVLRPAFRLPTTGLTSDLRLAARTLRKRPSLSATAILLLALAVGANTTVFSVVNAILLQPLPYQDPDRLVMIWDRYPAEQQMGDRSPVTLEHYRRWRAQTDLFSAVGVFDSTSMAIDHGGWPERIDGAMVTHTLLPMLGARPLHGRLLVAADEDEGAPPVVVLSHTLWQQRFGGDPSVVGTEIRLSGTPTRVVGVVDAGFWFYDPYAVTRSVSGQSAEAARFWTPIPRTGYFADSEDYPAFRLIARLADDIEFEIARAAAETRRRSMPGTSSGDEAELRMLLLSEQVRAASRPRLLALFGAVALVLLIACVNLAGLLLVHLDTRRSEFAVRVALGASRGRLVRQLVVESTLLALFGGVAGLFVATLATTWLVSLVPRGLPLVHRVSIDAGVVAFGMVLALLAGVAISILSSLRLDPRRLATTMAAGPRTMAGTRRGRRLHGILVTTEVTLCLVLLISATLLVRSMIGLRTTDTGFDPRGVLTFEALMISTDDGLSSQQFLSQLEDRLRLLPGVAASGATTALPFSRWAQRARLAIDGTDLAGDGPSGWIDHRMVTPGYFDAIALPVVAGRAFTASDDESAEPVAIVNEAFVSRYLPTGANAVGQVVTVTRGRTSEQRTIAGVVRTVKHNRLFEPARPILYAPSRQGFVPFQRFTVRAVAGDPLALVEPIRQLAAEIDPRQPLQEFLSFDALIAQSIEEETFYAQVLTTFAMTAVLLTLVGIYGVVSFATRQRDREVGIRMALGAGAGRVRRLILRQGLVPVGVGLVAGCVGALAAGRLLSGLLHGVPETDAASFASATVAFAIVAAAACLIPARRASRVDPVRVLRG